MHLNHKHSSSSVVSGAVCFILCLDLLFFAILVDFLGFGFLFVLRAFLLFSSAAILSRTGVSVKISHFLFLVILLGFVEVTANLNGRTFSGLKVE